LSVAYLFPNAASYDGEILHTDARRPCAGHVQGFMSIGVVVTKIMTFSIKMRACRPSLAGWLASLCITINSTGLGSVALAGSGLFYIIAMPHKHYYNL